MEHIEKTFYIKQLKTGCLAQYAYYIESDGRAVIVDPIRDIGQYLDLLKERKTKLKYVINTHVHADFVSGYCDLAKKTGAEVVIGPKKEAKFKHRTVKDGEEIKLGQIKLRILHTPGHTMESISIVVMDGKREVAVMTGDALFLGDVGRPDLAVKGEEITERDLTDLLFDSLKKLKKLSDDCIVLPAHGSGSACGKHLSKGDYCIIGKQKKTNYAMLIDNKDEFFEKITEDLESPPEYFKNDVRMNLQNDSIPSSEQVVQQGQKEFTPDQLEKLLNYKEYVVVDSRPVGEFRNGFIKNSIYLPLAGKFAIWAASLIKPEKKIIIVTNPDKLEESITRLTRTGLDNIVGHLKGGFKSWESIGKPVEKVEVLEIEKAVDYLSKNSNSFLLDVRTKGELANGSIVGSKKVLLDLLNDDEERLCVEWEMIPYCRSGTRATVAYSVLKRRGFKNLKWLNVGYEKAKEFFPTAEYK